MDAGRIRAVACRVSLCTQGPDSSVWPARRGPPGPLTEDMRPITFRASSQTAELGVAVLAPLLALGAHQSIGWDPPGLLVTLWGLIAAVSLAWLASAKRVTVDPLRGEVTEQWRVAGLRVRTRTGEARLKRVELRPRWQEMRHGVRSLAYDLVLVARAPDREIALKHGVQRFRGAEKRLRLAAEALRTEAAIRWSLVEPEIEDERRSATTARDAPFTLPGELADWRRYL